MKNSIINVQGLKKVLPHGAIIELSKRCNVSRTTVYSVLKGGSCNPIVLSHLKDYIQEVNSVIPEINSLVAEINGTQMPAKTA